MLSACGGDGGSGTPDSNSPTDVPFGTTAIVVVVNPTINDANAKTGLAAPGDVASGVTVTTDDNVSVNRRVFGSGYGRPIGSGLSTGKAAG